MKHPLLYVIVAVLLLCGCEREVSGKYIAKFTNGVYWLQLVRTPDNRLTGQLETAVVNTDGKIERHTVPVAGAVNAENVTISASSFGFQVLTLSGTLKGKELTLTGMQPSPITLTRTDLSDYQRQMSALNAQSQSIIAAKDAAIARERAEKAQKDLISEIDRALGRIQRFESEADMHLSRLPGAEEHYHAITAKMAEYVAREHKLAGDEKASVARSQLSVAASQASISTDQLHYSVQSLQSSLQTNIGPLATEATNLERSCIVAVPTGVLTPTETEARRSTCFRLAQAHPPFVRKFLAMSSALSHLEVTYEQERKAQDLLLQSAQRLQ
jgi:hypothetical protein